MRSPPFILLLMVALFCVALFQLTSIAAVTDAADQMVLAPLTQDVVNTTIYDETMVLSPSAVPSVYEANAEFAVYTNLTYGEAQPSLNAAMIVAVNTYDGPAGGRANGIIYTSPNPFNQNANPFNRIA